MPETMKELTSANVRGIAAAVLHQAVIDTHIKQYEYSARAWLDSKDAEFYMDCLDLAPDAFREKLKSEGGKGKRECTQIMLGI